MTPEDAASDFADAVAVRELRTLRDTLTAKLREAYLAGYAHAQNDGPDAEREDWIDPSDLDALLRQANTFPDRELEPRADTYTNVRDSMCVDTIDPESRTEVLKALGELMESKDPDERITDEDLAEHIGDASVCHIPDDLYSVLSTGFDLHGIDTLADLTTELQWQLALPDRSAA